MARTVSIAGFKSHYLPNEIKQETPNRPSLTQLKKKKKKSLAGLIS